MGSALALAIQALQALVTLLPLGEQLATQYNTLVTKLQGMQKSGADPTADDWAMLDAAVSALEAQLQSKN